MKAVREQVRSDHLHSFWAESSMGPRFHCPYHFHPEVELVLITSGHGQRLIGDHLDHFEAGDFLVLGPNLPHSYFHPPDYPNHPRGAGSDFIQFLPDAAGGLFSSQEYQPVARLFARASRGIVVQGAVHAPAVALMERITGVSGWRRWTLLLELLGILSEARGCPVLASANFVPERKPRQADRIEKICAWITARFREPLRLEEAARQAHMSPAAFSRFFSKATNRPFSRFLGELRVGHAARLLLETEHGIAQIAFDSGFENLSNFNRRFLELRGMTPRAYRAQTLQSADR